jgi:predicted SprT family Zn-dependent metalloprotease
MTMLKPVDLQQARREAAERFLAIGMSYLPAGWTFAYRKALTGVCYIEKKHIVAPKPVTRKALYIFLHECAHAHLHTTGRKKRHLEETEAEQWAHAKMRESGVPVPRSMTVRAKRHIRNAIRKAVVRGATSIDPAAIKFSRRKK